MCKAWFVYVLLSELATAAWWEGAAQRMGKVPDWDHEPTDWYEPAIVENGKELTATILLYLFYIVMSHVCQ